MSLVDKDNGFKAALETLKKSDIRIAVGVPGTSDEQLITVAAVHEFGSTDGCIPERSYLRSTVDENRELLLTDLTKQLKIASPDVAAMRVGLKLVGMIQNKIHNRIAPADKPATIKRKGSDVPLIDSGRLIQSIRAVKL